MADSARDEHGFGSVKEGRMPASVIKHKQRIANMTPEEKAKKFAGKSEEELKSMARRHGYGKDSTEYSKHGSEKKLDEVSLGKLVSYKNKAGEDYKHLDFIKGLTHSDSSVSDNVKKHYSKQTEKREKGLALADKKMKGKAKVNASAPKHPYMEETLDEKLTKRMSAADVIHDFVHSDDPKFKGKSVKQRQKMALGAYYGMHPEKKKRLEEMASRVKKTTAHRKLATGVNTQVRRSLQAEKGEAKTMLVTRKGDPRAAAGGGVMRISKDKYDPTIHNRASE